MSHTIYISHVIDAPVEEVWRIMRDFNGVPYYHPGIRKSEIEGDGCGDEVGCVRHLTLSDGFVREQLLCLDDLNYVFTYKIIDGTIPVRGYVAGVQLRRITQGNRTFTEWWADFEVIGADRDELIAHIGNNVFAVGLNGVASRLSE